MINSDKSETDEDGHYILIENNRYVLNLNIFS